MQKVSDILNLKMKVNPSIADVSLVMFEFSKQLNTKE